MLTSTRLFGDGKHGQAEQIQTFRCQACHTTFTARRNTPLYRLKTPSHQVAIVRISRWLKGWILQLLSVSSALDKRPSPAFLSRAAEHAQTLHEHCFRNLHLPHLQLDEFRTRLRNAKQVLWLWLAIDPCTKILPCSIWVCVRRPWLIRLFIPCDSSWLPAAFHSSQVMA